MFFLILNLMLLRWVGHVPIHTFRKLCYQLAGVKIGKGSTIHMWCNFYKPSGISIGEDTIIGNNAFLDGRASLKIGSHVAISSEVLIYNSEHDVHDENMVAVEEPVEIEDYAFIGPKGHYFARQENWKRSRCCCRGGCNSRRSCWKNCWRGSCYRDWREKDPRFPLQTGKSSSFPIKND